MTVPSARPWHSDESTLAAFVDGTVDPVLGASVEAHLMSCADCRGTVARLTSAELLEDVWSRVRDEVERPAPALVERLLVRIGVSEETSRLLAAVPALRGAWLLGVISATLFALLANEASQLIGTAAFLVIAPLAPLLGVSVSFSGDADPTSELVLTTPYSTLRLLLLRTGGVLASAVPVAVVVGLALPGPSWLSVAWLAPAAAVVFLTLALGPHLGHTVSAAVVGSSWALAVGTAVRMHSLAELVEPAVQLTCLALAVAGALSVFVHYRTLAHTWRTP
jgi:Putative zinc-finger